MASAVTSEKIGSKVWMKSYDHDPGSTSPIIVTPDGGTTKRYTEMDAGLFGVMLMQTVVAGGGTGTTLVDIVAAEDAAGTNVTTVVSSGAVQADAVGDIVFVECTAAQVKEVGDAAGFRFTHVGARITSNNAGDEAVVTYLKMEPRFAYSGLTATAIS